MNKEEIFTAHITIVDSDEKELYEQFMQGLSSHRSVKKKGSGEDISDARMIVYRQINRNKNIPDHAKQELIPIIADHFSIMSRTIGTYELLYLRKEQHKS